MAEWNIKIDYGISLQEMIRNGNYDECHSNVPNEYFLAKNTGIEWVTVGLVGFGLGVFAEEVEEELSVAGYKVGTIEHLLAIGILYPDLQRKHPIIALGSIAEEDHPCRCGRCSANRYSPHLNAYQKSGLRTLSVQWRKERYGVQCRFVCTR